MFFMDLTTPIQSKMKWENTPFVPVRPCLKLNSQQGFSIPNVSIQNEILHISYVYLKKDSLDRATIQFDFTDGGFFSESTTQRFDINSTSEPDVQSLSFPINEKMSRASKINVSIHPTSKVKELFILELTIAPREQLGLARARSFKDIRSTNEKSHFDFVFSKLTPPPVNNSPVINAKQNLGSYIKDYFAQAVSAKISFRERLEKLCKEKEKLKIISLCCGMAETEMKLMNGFENQIEITFCDLNEGLLKHIQNMNLPFAKVSTICCDINQIALHNDAYDVVIFVSGLHHVVELEKVLNNIQASLTTAGEVWLIAEYIGCNGAKLFEDCYQVANSIFKTLPSRYRFNHITQEHDSCLPNFDCSAATYEAIRSEEIIDLLSQGFFPLQEQKVNAFSWRFFNLIYQSNYDLNREFDKSIVDFVIHIDAYNVKEGLLKPSNLNGIYCKK